MAKNIVGKWARIKSNNPNGFSGHWGKVVNFDGDYFWISEGAFGTETMPFDRDEFTMMKGPLGEPKNETDNCRCR